MSTKKEMNPLTKMLQNAPSYHRGDACLPVGRGGDFHFLMVVGLQREVLSTARRPQDPQTYCNSETFGLHTCLGLLTVIPQYSQVYVFLTGAGLQRWPFSVVTNPQVLHLYTFGAAFVAFFVAFFATFFAIRHSPFLIPSISLLVRDCVAIRNRWLFAKGERRSGGKDLERRPLTVWIQGRQLYEDV
jgi:hypothetical protein